MKAHVLELPSGKNRAYYSIERVFQLCLSLILITLLLLYISENVPSALHSLTNINTTHNSTSIKSVKKCDIFVGKWVPHLGDPYYNSTCPIIFDAQNCMKFGRPDTDFLKWRWKPDDCELPIFDALQFLELVKGKSLAFVGDSVGRNQMQSLVCLLSSVAYPEEIILTNTTDTRFKSWFYEDYNFTIATFWSPYLVKARNQDENGFSRNSLMSLYLDEADESWTAKIEIYDYVIISAGQWFFRPAMYYENGEVAGCFLCNKENITALINFYGYKMAFRSAFRALQNLSNYKGMTILRTFSTAHFENGDWNKGGNCPRTMPFNSEKHKIEYFNEQLYLAQIEEFREAAKRGKERGLEMRLLNTTQAMFLRPDGHPNQYGHPAGDNSTSIADCVHWCMPGPIDTWNEFLLKMLKSKGDEESGRLQDCEETRWKPINCNTLKK